MIVAAERSPRLGDDVGNRVGTVRRDRVVGTFDRNMFFNPPGAGTNIGSLDNRRYAQNLVLWAAGIQASTPCPGDVNGDGLSDAADLSVLISGFGCIAP